LHKVATMLQNPSLSIKEITEKGTSYIAIGGNDKWIIEELSGPSNSSYRICMKKRPFLTVAHADSLAEIERNFNDVVTLYANASNPISLILQWTKIKGKIGNNSAIKHDDSAELDELVLAMEEQSEGQADSGGEDEKGAFLRLTQWIINSENPIALQLKYVLEPILPSDRFLTLKVLLADCLW
jgi:hypothetical protein